MSNKNKSESKEQRFKRVASNRTGRALNYLRLLGNCSNRGIYNYGTSDVSKIFSTIEKELRRIKGLFTNKAKPDNFTL